MSYESQTTSPSPSDGTGPDDISARHSHPPAKISRYLVVGAIELDDPAKCVGTIDEAQRLAMELTTKYAEHGVGFAVVQFVEIGRYEPARPIWVTP